MSGKLISFEGPEGSGKSTQCRLLCEKMNKMGHKTVLTREPGGTQIAEKIREILVTGDTNKIIAKTEMLLHYAVRVEHVEKFIKPNLETNVNVICDRFIDSSTAYQAYGHGIDIKDIELIREITLGNFLPDITFIMDISPQDGLKRTLKRADEENRYEKMGLEFHNKVYQGYKKIYEENKDRCVVIDANANIEDVADNIMDCVKKLY